MLAKLLCAQWAVVLISLPRVQCIPANGMPLHISSTTIGHGEDLRALAEPSWTNFSALDEPGFHSNSTVSEVAVLARG
jgi:hypothetical protein